MGDEEAAPSADPPAESATEPPASAEAGSEAPPSDAPPESPPEAPPAEAPPEAASATEAPPAETHTAEAPPAASPESPPKAPDEAPSDMALEPSNASLKPKDHEIIRGTDSTSSKPHVRTSVPAAMSAHEVTRGKSSMSRMELGRSASKIASSASLKKSMSVVSEKGKLSSKGKLALGSVLSIKRLDSIEEKGEKGKVARYANSYKLESDNPFNSEKVEKILESVMVELLENMTYDQVHCPKQAKWAASAIRGKVKELGFDSTDAKPKVSSTIQDEELVVATWTTSAQDISEEVSLKPHARFNERPGTGSSETQATTTSSLKAKPKQTFGFAKDEQQDADEDTVEQISNEDEDLSPYDDEKREKTSRQPQRQFAKECEPFLKVENFAEIFVDEILDVATEKYDKKKEIENCIEIEGFSFDVAEHDKDKSEEQPDETPSSSTISATVSVVVDWPTLEDFTTDLGLYKIEEFISYWDFQEDWKYCINFLEGTSDQTTDMYRYEVIFSVPCKVYPIPQATASVYFTIEASRVKPRCCGVDVFYQFECNRLVHTPGKYHFQETWLFNIVDAKIKFYKTLKF